LDIWSSNGAKWPKGGNNRKGAGTKGTCRSFFSGQWNTYTVEGSQLVTSRDCYDWDGNHIVCSQGSSGALHKPMELGGVGNLQNIFHEAYQYLYWKILSSRYPLTTS